MSVVDWGKLESELERQLDKWEKSNSEPLSTDLVEGFEYGFELGFRIASGEKIQ